jgi:penicillin-binding protein 1A
MAASYAVFANHGVRAPATPVRRVLDADGTVLEDNTGVRGERVMDAAVADTVTDVMAGVVTSGTGTGAAIGRPVAGKTGTAEDYRAAWFVGYTPQLSTAVWMGYADTPRPLENIGGYGSVTGGSLPAMAWAQFMGTVHEALPVIEFTAPGPLPVPEGASALEPGPQDWPSSPPMGCGGVCPVATTEPPSAEEDESDGAAGDDSDSDGDSDGDEAETGDGDPDGADSGDGDETNDTTPDDPGEGDDDG